MCGRQGSRATSEARSLQLLTTRRTRLVVTHELASKSTGTMQMWQCYELLVLIDPVLNHACLRLQPRFEGFHAIDIRTLLATETFES